MRRICAVALGLLIAAGASSAWSQTNPQGGQCVAGSPDSARRAAACLEHQGCRLVLNRFTDCERSKAFLARLPIPTKPGSALDSFAVFEAAQPTLSENAELRQYVVRARDASRAPAVAAGGRGVTFTSAGAGQAYYEGGIREGRLEGEGILIAENGALVRGEFRASQIEGWTQLITPDGGINAGQHKAGLLDGLGAIQLPDGSALSGSLVRGHFIGRALQTLPDGSSYVAHYDANGAFIVAGPPAPRGAAPRDPGVEALKALAAASADHTKLDVSNLLAAELLYRRLLALQRSAYGDESLEAAHTYYLLGGALAGQWKNAEAETTLRRALSLRIALLGETHADTALTYDALAFVLRADGRFDEAIALHEKALAASRAALGEARLITAHRYAFLALVQDTAGRLGKAELNYRMAMDSAVSAPDAGEWAIFHVKGLANFYTQRGRTTDAASLYERALRLRQATFPEGTLQGAALSQHYAALSADLFSVGRRPEAEAFQRRAIEVSTAAGAADAVGLVDRYIGLARILVASGRESEADQLYARAIQQYPAADTPRSVRTTLAYESYAKYLEERDRCGDAIGWWRRALAFREADSSLDSLTHAATLVSIGKCQMRIGDFPGAEASFRTAIRLTLKAGPTFYLTPQAEAGLAESLAAQGRLSEAESTAGQAVEAARGRARLMGPQAGSASLADETLPFARYLGIAWPSGAQDRALEAPLRARAFAAAQDIMASASALAMAQAAARTATQGGRLASAVRQEQDLSALVRDLDGRYFKALAASDPATAGRIRADAEAAKARLDSVAATIDREFPAYRELVSPAALGLADVQRLLQPDEGLLLFAIADDDVYSFAVSRSAVAWSRATGQKRATAEDIAALRCELDPETCSRVLAARLAALPPSPSQRAGYERYDLAAAHRLYANLVRPSESALSGVRRLYVVGSGPLAELPLAALVTEPPVAGADMADPAVLAAAPWLGDRYALTTLPAVSALRLRTTQRPGPAASNRFRGYGDPVLGEPELQEAPRGSAGRGLKTVQVFRGLDATGDRMADGKILLSLPSLPGTRAELSAMAQLFGKGEAGLRVGRDATERAIRADPDLQSADVIAIATHGLLPNAALGMDEPGLVFTPPAAASADDDGILTASEASGLTLAADWAILSACNTASSGSGGDSLSALSRGFLYAGARALLASHWRVSDKTTAVLTVETLSNRRRGGVTRSQALQKAMSAVRSGRRADGASVEGWSSGWAHPAYWAAFTHIANQDE